MPLPRDRHTAWLLVLGQFALLAVVIWPPGRTGWNLPSLLTRATNVATGAGIVLMVLAAPMLGRGLSAAPLPNEHTKLRTTGLYRWVRHPIYSGLLLFAIGQAAGSGNAWSALACALLVVLINVKARWEERHLVQRFPDYLAYAGRTPRFIPWPKTH